MTAWHLGAMHPIEQGLTVALAIGPFLVLGGVILWRRRQDQREDAALQEAEAQRDR